MSNFFNIDTLKIGNIIYIQDKESIKDYLKTKIVSINDNKYKIKSYYYDVEIDKYIKDSFLFNEITKEQLKKLYPRYENGKLIRTEILSDSTEHFIYDKEKYPNAKILNIEEVKQDRYILPRIINDNNMEIVFEPILINWHGKISNGNHRHEYSIRKGYTKIPVIYV